ncbi:hypothetical protein [Paracoccus sp. (in: a-proteobacteria)]|uniref:hypothetical protein n=1 Tax=Paracoccus sp. TaxID=267 RepID=UPI002AFE8244|nr:hypothetical protein [Paracoccus sp. (in: a-proteobacteria)]
MTKAKSKGQKLAERRRRAMAEAGLPELAPIERRNQPRQNGRFVRVEEDPRKVVLNKRCRDMGEKETRENRRLMSQSMLGDHVGQALYLDTPKDAERLWQTFCKLDAADAVYHARVLGRSRHAKCGKVEFMPERLETRPDDGTDYRSDDERYRSAVNNWMRWHGYVGRLAGHEQSAIWDGVYMRCEMHKGGKVTTRGRSFVAALRMLSLASQG